MLKYKKTCSKCKEKTKKLKRKCQFRFIWICTNEFCQDFRVIWMSQLRSELEAEGVEPDL